MNASSVALQAPGLFGWSDRWPAAFRLVGLNVVRKREAFHCAADLYHRNTALSVTWSAPAVGSEIEVGALVRPELPMLVGTGDGPLVVSGLRVPRQPERDVNLFDTVRPERSGQPSVIGRARRLIDALPHVYRHLFNAIFWDQRRFARFCVNPASISNHHAHRHGLLLHTVETAEIALGLCRAYPRANRGLALVAALLHDAGKADEYFSRLNGTWGLTDRGRLIGHGVTVYEWIAAAVANASIDLRQDAYQALIHVLTARAGAPDWLGIRKPAMIENEIVTIADRFSSRMNLHDRLAAPGGGWGARHPHRGEPFTLLERD